MLHFKEVIGKRIGKYTNPPELRRNLFRKVSRFKHFAFPGDSTRYQTQQILKAKPSSTVSKLKTKPTSRVSKLKSKHREYRGCRQRHSSYRDEMEG
ncbi:hypothetical protein RRG08_048392 [Elysia crispata]|uniref:Uncharacterized protein n=1 Tax=Elysia crispata TaxID=231223 RepID=A0AAE1B9I7_9GAST|nr:hypothetical protein RRG08_048392 [Elysia crispata]